ncbi:urea amidolyase associated protein UAAP2 [Sinirhodobacter huangdaonensis]|uniref:DUF1989 domain-containing protein n=1 Tax=Paenirhodobacter huangdaonensis TaxID=2501515 RepID=A0A3S3LD58_9RHOB|nr:urea amidolyase associated protein UAAP2 [Sinirhodobacter huangdaonensis]RWR52187.1 DUF1989 domain-containing protein [Sinirhodobacter huangdaonensis]
MEQIHDIPANRPWSGLVKQGQTIRIIDSYGQQAIDTLLYNAADPAERYSSQDTMRVQNGAYIEKGTQLISSEGNLMATITEATSGRHDTNAGCCSRESNTVRFGHETSYLHACRENFILEFSEYGMTKRDIVPNLNFFMNVPISQNGAMTIDDGISHPGDYIEMEAAMDLLVFISNCPQINNPCNGFDPTPIRVVIRG